MTKDLTINSKTTLKPTKPRSKFVKMYENEVYSNSLTLSKELGIIHESIKKTIRKHESHLRKHGILTQILNPSSKSNNKEKIYLLNEEQSYFLVTLSKNTEKVVAFKSALITEFFKMKKHIQEIETYQSTIDLTKKMTSSLVRQGLSNMSIQNEYGYEINIFRFLSGKLNKHILKITSKDKARKHFNDKRTSLSIREMIRQHDKYLDDLYIETEHYLINRVIPKLSDGDDVFSILENKIIAYINLVLN